MCPIERGNTAKRQKTVTDTHNMAQISIPQEVPTWDPDNDNNPQTEIKQ